MAHSLLLSTLAAATLFALVSGLKFSAFRYSFDTAVLLNVLWRLSHGYDSVSTLSGFAHSSDHPSLLLLYLVPLARIAGPWIPQVLFALRGLSVAMVGLSVWKVARARGITPAVSTSLYIVTLLGAGSWFAATGEFHLADLALGPLASLAANAMVGHPKRALFWAAVAASARIEIAAAVLVVGLVMKTIFSRNLRIALIAVSVLAGLAMVAISMASAGGGASLSAHLGHLGSTRAEAFVSIVRTPIAVVKPLWSPLVWMALFFWLSAFGLFPTLLGWRWLLPALPMVAIPILGTWKPADSYFEHYWHVLLVFGALATVEGLRRLRISPRSQCLLLVGSCLVAWGVFGPVNKGLPASWRVESASPEPVLASILADLPPSAPLSAPIDLIAVLSLRREVSFFPRPYSCRGTEGILPRFVVPEWMQPPELVIAVTNWPSSDPVWTALGSSYEASESVGIYQVWRLRDAAIARAAMVECRSGQFEPSSSKAG